jgi:uncharacterized membrane protein YeaQ/YmgE (transglycosylase-associated protein family)
MLGAVLLTILLGALVGWLASLVMNRDAEQSAFDNVVVGVLGAIVGTLLFSLFDGDPGFSPFINLSLGSLFVAFVGAVVVCALLNYRSHRRIR